MASFAENTWFHVINCSNCGVQYALANDYRERRIKDRETFYCPNGHSQAYSGPTEAQKLREELDRKEEMLHSAELRAEKAETERNNITRAHKKMRERVMNGVCPCCNRSFANLREHMKNEHADFGSVKTLFALRTAFGMTQTDVAREAGVDYTHVSLYERDKPLAPYARKRLDTWLEAHGAETEKS
jgi:DNA-binding XRE family transcriptional regulator